MRQAALAAAAGMAFLTLAGCAAPTPDPLAAQADHWVALDDTIDHDTGTRQLYARSHLNATPSGDGAAGLPQGKTLDVYAQVDHSGARYTLILRDTGTLPTDDAATLEATVQPLRQHLDESCQALPLFVDGRRIDLPVLRTDVDVRRDYHFQGPQPTAFHRLSSAIALSVPPPLMRELAAARELDYRMCGLGSGTMRATERESLREVYRRSLMHRVSAS
ncbi:MAG: hypothetical protein M0R28_11285 [Pigmentiphaga sp.]|nr:hypothetical protein [Pigmentiphaga sp.]